MDKGKYYELHVTVLPQHILEFGDFCKRIPSGKPLYIQLHRGLHQDQPMLAMSTTDLKDDKDAMQWAKEYSGMVNEHFPVTRTKLESRLVDGPNEYYEAHWKLEFPFGYHSAVAGCIPTEVGLVGWDNQIEYFLEDKPHLLRSRNLLDTRIHYLSQRIYGSSDPLSASRKFNASGVAINFGGLPLVKTHYERCVWDSNPELDLGWAT